MKKMCQGVFAGGGVRGIGHVGAALAFEEAGYTFVNLAGSSAGAIVAALIAAGYTADELHQEMLSTNYLKFKQKDWLDRLTGIGKFFSILLNFGVYNADYFEGWLSDLLAKKNIRTFGDLRSVNNSTSDRLQITATDLLEKRLLLFPEDLELFGIDPMTYPIAKAVRMSMSIPIFFEPFRIRDQKERIHHIVDGGLISNYPIWILDDGKMQKQFPVFGFRFLPSKVCEYPECVPKLNLISYCKSLISTVLDGYDNHVAIENDKDQQRTIQIPTLIDLNGKQKRISSTDFEITQKESEALFQNGYHAGQKLLSKWDLHLLK